MTDRQGDGNLSARLLLTASRRGYSALVPSRCCTFISCRQTRREGSERPKGIDSNHLCLSLVLCGVPGPAVKATLPNGQLSISLSDAVGAGFAARCRSLPCPGLPATQILCWLLKFTILFGLTRCCSELLVFDNFGRSPKRCLAESIQYCPGNERRFSDP